MRLARAFLRGALRALPLAVESAVLARHYYRRGVRDGLQHAANRQPLQGGGFTRFQDFTDGELVLLVGGLDYLPMYGARSEKLAALRGELLTEEQQRARIDQEVMSR